MNRVVRVNATDKRIMYIGYFRRDQTTTWIVPPFSCSLHFIFRGTGIRVYGRRQYPIVGGTTAWRLDAITTLIPLNESNIGSDISPMYHADNMQDGDHQFYVTLQLTQGTMGIEYFEIENSSGDGFDLLSAGPNAENVPAQAFTVDDFDARITYHNESLWTHVYNDPFFYDKSSSFTETIGSSLSYSFNGVEIWYYGAIGPNHGFFNVSIDGSTPQRLSAENDGYLYQQLLWSNVSLGPGRHNLTITHDEPRSLRPLSLDFFRVLPEPVFSTTSPEVLPTDVQPVTPANQSQTNRVPLAVGVTLGLLALVVGVLGSVFYQYRRRGRVLGALPISPFAVPPVRQANLQQSRLPQGGKRPPQLAPPAGTPINTGIPPMYSHGSELGSPPSYESPPNA